MPEKSCCCCQTATDTPCGDVSVVSSALTFWDRLGSWKVRWGIGRMQFRIEPGLYAIGNPTADSPVLVTANYKMSFDILRSSVAGLAAWILVLDTKGVNVWCAAGKKTFGTDEIVRRIEQTSLRNVVSHRTVIVPQLGAVGVCAREVAQQSDFQVVFGPVRAADIPLFLDRGMQATPAMRTIEMTAWDRTVLAPVELVSKLKYIVVAAVVFFFLFGFVAATLATLLPTLGIVLGPILLPWLPSRSFWLKGACLGAALSLITIVIHLTYPGALGHGISVAAWCLIMPALTSFTLMNFTGCTTFTSFSGVKYEMRRGLPFQFVAGLLGIVALVVGTLIGVM